MSETTVQRQVRMVLEAECAEMGRVIASACSAGTGFVLVMFDFCEANKGNMAYLSNGRRPETIKMLKELLEKIEGDTGEPRNSGSKPGSSVKKGPKS